jgi:hypothetical protein
VLPVFCGILEKSQGDFMLLNSSLPYRTSAALISDKQLTLFVVAQNRLTTNVVDSKTPVLYIIFVKGKNRNG